MTREAIASRLLALRTRRRWTQGQVEARSGVSKMTVSNYERGRFSYRLDLLEAILGAYGMPLSRFIAECER